MIKKRTAIFILLCFCFCSFVFAGDPADSDSVRDLEVEYPSVEGSAPTDIEYGIAEYVSYAFSFIFLILGAVFFSVLVYNGVKYMISTGDVEKTGAAMKGIKSAFLGVVIFLSSWFLLNSINPGLTQIEITEMEEINPTKLTPGAYVCNYNLDGIEGILNKYYDHNTRSEAINELYEKYAEKREEDEDSWCILVNMCVNLPLHLESGRNTYFVIPEITSERNEEGEIVSEEIVDRHGIIFFRLTDGLENARGQEGGVCYAFIGNPNSGYAGSPDRHDLGWVSSPRSMCAIRLNTDDNVEYITFYQGYSFNEPVGGNKDHSGKLGSVTVTVGDHDIKTINRSFFSVHPEFTCEDNVGWPGFRRDVCGIRSVAMSRNLFAFFVEEDDACTIIEGNNENLEKIITTRSTREDQGFPRMIHFEDVKIIKGSIME